jgi:hypothetical protein
VVRSFTSLGFAVLFNHLAEVPCTSYGGAWR